MAKARDYVLVHGAFHGGWCWRRVADRLAVAGHRVFAPSLTGLGDRRHLLTPSVNLDTHIDDIVELISTEELTDIVLVGHSYGGIVITGVADRIPQRIRQLVYLDAVLVEAGGSWGSALPPDVVDAREKSAAESSAGLSLPVPKAANFGVHDADDQAWVDRRMTPHPFSTLLRKMHWRNPVGNGLPKIYVDCTDPPHPPLVAMKDQYRGKQGWPFVAIHTRHDCMVSAPDETTELLLRYA
jgi:pimeloyl-ACP methyl ester carboxylesterase